MRNRLAMPALLALILVPAAFGRAAAATAPALALDFGKTTAIAGPVTSGGISLGLGALWRVDESPWMLPIRFGAMVYWDDMGTRVDELTNGSGAYLGLAAGPHVSTYGAAFRLDYEPALKFSWRPYASGTWGFYRIAGDLRGGDVQAISSTGFSLGAGINHHLYEGHSIGLVVRYHRLFNDVNPRYVSAGLEWGWRGGQPLNGRPGPSWPGATRRRS